MQLVKRLLVCTSFMVLPSTSLVYPSPEIHTEKVQEQPETEPPSYTDSLLVSSSTFKTPERAKPVEPPKPAHNPPQQKKIIESIDRSEIKQKAQEMCDSAFGEGHFTSLDLLINAESGWNHLAMNRSSGAYGIGQALPATKMAPFGADYRTNPETQLKWLMSYIRDRYINPSNAWNFWKLHHWY